jgi:hypothetical protein
VAYDPVNTPVLVLSSTWRATSLLVPAWRRYSATMAACSGTVSASTSGCSGANTMNEAPNRVSGRVVNTVIGPAAEAKSTRAPSLRPIQLRCIALIESVQSSRSRSSTSRSAYAVIRIIHWRMLRLNTGKLPRSLRPSAVTSSLATTVPRPGHQLTGASLM